MEGCQPAPNSYQGTASNSFHLVRTFAPSTASRTAAVSHRHQVSSWPLQPFEQAAHRAPLGLGGVGVFGLPPALQSGLVFASLGQVAPGGYRTAQPRSADACEWFGGWGSFRSRAIELMISLLTN